MTYEDTCRVTLGGCYRLLMIMNQPGYDNFPAPGQGFPGTAEESSAVMVLLDVRNLTCSRSDTILFRGLAFAVNTGEVLQVEGANGSGKTTLLKTLCGFIEPDTGEVFWQGRNIRDCMDDFLPALHYVGHTNGIKTNLSCIENLRVAHALARRGRTADWSSILVQYGLAGYEGHPAHLLSSGQRRRLALARLSVCHADLWILDEPFTSLDEAGRAMLKEIFRNHLDSGGSIILTSHDEIAWDGITVRKLRL